MEQSQKAQAASESQAAKKPSIAQQFVPPTIASRVGTHGARTNSAGEKVADFHMPPASTQFPSDVDPSANWEQYATLYPVGTKIDLTVRDGQKDAYIFPGEVSQEFEFREWLDGTFFGIQSDLPKTFMTVPADRANHFDVGRARGHAYWSLYHTDTTLNSGTVVYLKSICGR